MAFNLFFLIFTSKEVPMYDPKTRFTLKSRSRFVHQFFAYFPKKNLTESSVRLGQFQNFSPEYFETQLKSTKLLLLCTLNTMKMFKNY